MQNLIKISARHMLCVCLKSDKGTLKFLEYEEPEKIIMSVNKTGQFSYHGSYVLVLTEQEPGKQRKHNMEAE